MLCSRIFGSTYIQSCASIPIRKCITFFLSSRGPPYRRGRDYPEKQKRISITQKPFSHRSTWVLNRDFGDGLNRGGSGARRLVCCSLCQSALRTAMYRLKLSYRWFLVGFAFFWPLTLSFSLDFCFSPERFSGTNQCPMSPEVQLTTGRFLLSYPLSLVKVINLVGLSRIDS